MNRKLLTTAEVAAKLGRPVEWLYKNRNKLVGFPPPVQGCGYRWDPAAIDAWLDRLAGLASAEPVLGEIGPAGDVVDITALRQELRERGRRIAAGG